jgi:hypothetical protein
MTLKSVLAAAVLIMGSAAATQAQDLLDGNNVDEILNIARGYGSGTLETQGNGNPRIEGRMDGILYHVYFMNCNDNHTDCEDIYFYAGFLDNKQTMEAINAWNRDRRFGRAYLDTDLDAVIEYDMNLEYGISRQNLDAGFSIWKNTLAAFVEYTGQK